ncbi:MAG: hypothetical protein H6579_00255 [Chitinophagales bacterium]|nr:hypothetical protein [Chitinophagales bacterium]
MKIYLSLSFLVLLSFSCTHNNTNTKDANNLMELEADDFTYLEDYLSIKNRSDLLALFGEEAVADDTSWYAEGSEMFLSSQLENPQNKQVISFVWGENMELLFIEAPFAIYDEDYIQIREQRIESSSGLFTGMSLNELREWNEDEFEFYGFSWDYEGTIVADAASKIMQCPVSFNLSLSYDSYTGGDELTGDVLLKSEDSIVQAAPIYIDQLTLPAVEF